MTQSLKAIITWLDGFDTLVGGFVSYADVMKSKTL